MFGFEHVCIFSKTTAHGFEHIHVYSLSKKAKKKTHQKPNPPSPPPKKKNFKTKNKVTSTRISFFKQYFIWFIFAAKSDLVINKCVISDKRLIHLCDIISLLFGEWFFFCNSNIFLYSTGFDKLVPCMNSGTVQRLFFEDLLFTGLAFMDVFSRNGSLPCQ